MRQQLSNLSTYTLSGTSAVAGAAPRIRHEDVEAAASKAVSLLAFPVEIAAIQFAVGDFVALAGVCIALMQYVHNVRRDKRRDKHTYQLEANHAGDEPL